MKTPRPVEVWLADIVRSGEKLARHIDGFTLSSFLDDEKTQDAASKCAEEIGGEANEILKLEPDFDSRHPDLNLAAAYASRNKLSHSYHAIDYAILWRTATKSIPPTVKAAREVLTQYREEKDAKAARENDGGDGAGGGIGGGP